MKVLFIIPNYPEKIRSYLVLPSLELAVMSAVLEEKGHVSQLLDMKINGYQPDDLFELLPQYSYDLVCIESTTQDHCEAIKIIEKCKLVNPNVPVVLRGEISSFMPEECLNRYTSLDYVMRFENEKTLLELVNALECNSHLDRIGNIAYRWDGKVVVTDLEMPLDKLDELPFPNRRLYDMKKYYDKSVETIVRSTRGCPGKCKFCNKTKLSPFREFSISRFCNEIEDLISLGFTQFFFSDDSFSYSDKRVSDFCDEIKRRNLHIRFTSNMRIVDINEYKIKRLKEAGAYRFFVGIETINANSSKVINKNLTKKSIVEKLDILRKYGLEFHASFILGNPGDTEADLAATLDFINEIKPTLVSFNQLKPMPGTELYYNSDKYGVTMEDKFWFEKEDWTEHAICSTRTLSSEKIDEWKRKMLLSFIRG